MARNILNKDAINKRYLELLDESKYSSHQRGYEFEHILFSLLHNAGLEPRASYKPKGEQVDGSFFWQGQTFLVEAKWVKDPLPVSSIYSFKGKLDGKFHTTSGVFVAVNGFSPDVEDALRFGKTLNVILFDETDVPLLLEGEVDFVEMLRFKLREAGDTGSVKVPYKLKQKAEQISYDPKEILNVDKLITKVNINSVPDTKLIVTDLLVFVEGQTDVEIATRLLEKINVKFISFRVVPLNGVNNIRELPALLNVFGLFGKTKAVIILLDLDVRTSQLIPLIENITEQIRFSSIPVKSHVLYLPDSVKLQLSRSVENINGIESASVLESLEDFIQDIANEYHDPVIDTPSEVLKNRTESLRWVYDEQIVEADDDNSRHPVLMKSLDELVDYLNEEIVVAMHGEMPLEWLKEQDYLDYEGEVREYLLDNYSEHITKLGWNVSEL